MTFLSPQCDKPARRPMTVILGVSALSALLLIFGPDLLTAFGPTSQWSQKAMTLSSNMLAWFLLIWAVSPPTDFITCRYQAWKNKRATK